ncbi:MAG: DJ-1/PfpI family protein [Candidatus Aenigmatarchaeota archaeon]
MVINLKVLVPLAEGFEEIEAITIIDVLRRAKIEVVTAFLQSNIVEGAHKIKVMADKRISEINEDEFDAIVLPGGNPGYINLANSKTVLELIKKFDEKNKVIGAICGAPLVLAKAGVIENKIATCYPGLEKNLPKPKEGRVVIDKNIITSKGPGTALLFAIKLVEMLAGKKEAMRLKEELVVSDV